LARSLVRALLEALHLHRTLFELVAFASAFALPLLRLLLLGITTW
jgi:hypothetical protein